MTDRECMIAIMDAILALSEKLTGERLTIRCETDGGNVAISGSGGAHWKKAETERATPPCLPD